MNSKALTVSIAAGTAVLYAWQAVSHMLIPWHEVMTSATTAQQLIGQAGIDLGVIAGLAGFAMLLHNRSALGLAKAFAIGAALFTASAGLTAMNWLSVSLRTVAVDTVDAGIGFFLAGLAMGFVFLRLDPGSVIIPEGQGYRTSGGRKTVAR